MYVQIFLLIIGLGILYTYAGEHGCGASCPLRARARPGQLCSCACATCPCSPASRLQETLYSLPETMKDYCDKVIEMVKSRITYLSRPHLESETEFPDLNTLSLSDYVIEDSTTLAGRRSASLPDFGERERPSLAAEAAGGTSHTGVQTSKMRNTTDSSKLGEEAATLSGRCRKCKEKGVTCMVKCPAAKK